jgi:uncharacterized protein YqhQ
MLMLGGFSLLNTQWARMFASGQLAAVLDNSNFFNLFSTVIHSVLFLLLLRATPMAGIHAAEHQTVWAIEKGLPLRPEVVAQMPRAHPRCGTNLVALAGLIAIIFQHLPSYAPEYVIGALLFVFFAWRSFGEALQNVFTTRPATRKQLESGIRAGREVLERYQQQPHVMGSFGSRLLNSGMAYSAMGMIATLFILQFGAEALLRNWPWR